MAAAAPCHRHRVRRLPARRAAWPLVRCGPPGPRLVSLANQPGDLLVIGAGRRAALTRLVCCPVARHCLAHAHCPVLAVPAPTWPGTRATACAAGQSATAGSTRPRRRLLDRPARGRGAGPRPGPGTRLRPQSLTPRELDVLREMAAGRSNARVAAHLHLSESSVGKHVNAIFTKLGLTTEDQSHCRAH
jgi:DNA-binding CsgD family transcriptional regulator